MSIFTPAFFLMKDSDAWNSFRCFKLRYKAEGVYFFYFSSDPVLTSNIFSVQTTTPDAYTVGNEYRIKLSDIVVEEV